MMCGSDSERSKAVKSGSPEAPLSVNQKTVSISILQRFLNPNKDLIGGPHANKVLHHIFVYRFGGMGHVHFALSVFEISLLVT